VVSERRAFGDRLRRQRERRGVTLEAIARSTKVSASLFAALERGDCSRWPGGVYSRAYIRAYAELVGLDPNEAVEDFTAAFADTALADALDTGKRPARRASASLRLSMDDQPEFRELLLVRRTVFALADLAVASGLAWVGQALLDTGVWGTAAFALAYYAGARIITDEPLLAWVFNRFHSAPAVDLTAAEDVSVTDPARTTA
jgi:transcriptional regulator with XRE-family HTH domain